TFACPIFSMTGAVWTRQGSRVIQSIQNASSRRSHTALKSEYDVLVIGGGRNAAYLQKGGLQTAVLERRHVLGGAAVTEELFPGFHFSRCSYLLSLFRPHIYEDLELKKHGLKIYRRNPHAFSPMLEDGVGGAPPRSLTLGSDMVLNRKEIGKFSQKDAMVGHFRAAQPLLDAPPVDIIGLTSGSLRTRITAAKTLMPLVKCGLKLGKNIPDFYEIVTAPIMKILNQWFESEPLKATLATDAVIGAMTSPYNPGSGYVLLHHVMGELEKEKGSWGYVEGGMGGVSNAIASSARSHGASIFTEKDVQEILVGPDGVAKGVVLKDGSEIHSKLVLSNATPYVTFKKLTPQASLSPEFIKAIDQFDYTSPSMVLWMYKRTSTHKHKNTNKHTHSLSLIHYGGFSFDRPMLEMTIPSVLDPTLAPPGAHVVSFFTQFTPYYLEGKEWTDQDKEAYADLVFDWVEQYAPGFKSSVVGRDILTPPDLERIFGLTGGNIFHGSMSLDQLYLARPLPCLSNYRTPIKGLYLCGSGCHPGGGVMGSPGWNAALAVMADMKRS
uniref:Pyridine nucleotide-disulfide oxidoreductase domain-containing protein 2 n=1 Tax=Gadus morhua TaxID=8049 RepID=A0A8C5BKN7_GADMO